MDQPSRHSEGANCQALPLFQIFIIQGLGVIFALAGALLMVANGRTGGAEHAAAIV
jgi:hypothetical protein